MRQNFASVALLCAVVFAGCESPPTEPAANEAPQFDFMNGPDELSNVFRFERNYGLQIVDPTSGLRAFAGLPTVPSTFIGCRSFGFIGSDQLQLMGQQIVGAEPPLVFLISEHNANLHVFKYQPFFGFCRSTVFARGTGRFIGNDNDLTFSGERWNVWGWHMTGDVTILSTGETARLNAFVKFRGRLGEGPAEILTRKVELN